ncbi:putative chloride channel protein [Psilocybe cubensis]|uniref:Chloride channel protein n=1 Tax=Psilocybe cubensis TaxID=181762 RepID=A0ACB8HC60_PSICU|nr:putative chloride channel protein [Psilocybe cubensis]KAH9485066.1 putative chloride channel protein [Psilocybe cubensis]
MDPDELEDEELEEIRRYEDFTTIDWIQDSVLERKRRLRYARHSLLPRRSRGGLGALTQIWAQARKIMTAGQSWFVLSIIGVCIGLNAAIVSIVSEWLSDIKMGYCSDGWWLNQQFCCWEIEGEEVDGCPSWHTWSHVTLARWLIFVLFATLINNLINVAPQMSFSFVASHLVRSFAKYAAGSGISEIKCILAGFVMQGFLGFATFFIKSITLVRPPTSRIDSDDILEFFA